MTAVAKVPDSADWQAIDIYLFSNGQQYSPPRKYHLNAQELNWWRAILSLLAKSLYGTQHSTINLYTVNGDKIEGPLQLSNGTAYVAVKPAERFIDTGYSEYLLKASRSWEKSQARRSNSVEINQDEVECNVVTALSNTSISNKKNKQKIIADETANNKVDQNNKIDRPQPLLNALEYSKRDTNIKPTAADKRRISPIQRFSILRKSSTAPPPLSAKKYSGKTNDVPKNAKRIFKVNDKAFKNNCGAVTTSNIQQKNASCVVAKKQKITKEKETHPILKDTNTNILITDLAQRELRGREKNDFVADIFKSTDSEIPSMVVPLSATHIAKNTHHIFNNMSNEYNADQTKVTIDGNKNIKDADLPVSALKAITSEKALSIHMLDLSKTQIVPNVSSTEKFHNCMFINKGDKVNLKLQIKVKNGHSILKNTGTEQEIRPSINNVKTERGSQINVDSVMIVRDKLLKSIFVSDFKENVGANDNSKGNVFRCVCCQNNNCISQKDATNLLSNSKMYIVLKPTFGFEKRLCRCQCIYKVIDDDETEIPKANSPSIINPIKKTDSTIELEILSNTTDESKTIKLTVSGSDKNSFIPKVAEYGENEREILNPEDVDNNNFKIKCTKISSSTQTELCSLLLEARRHEDGRYTFHLPPLNILKYYQL